jgi:hypothetical protein
MVEMLSSAAYRVFAGPVLEYPLERLGGCGI